jgi:RHS repeat-associated protein
VFASCNLNSTTRDRRGLSPCFQRHQIRSRSNLDGSDISWFPAVGIADRTTPAGWNYYEGSITAPSNAAYVLFYAEIHGAGDPDTSLTTAYFDSAVFSASASLWNQTYTYDQYDNLTKNGNPGTSWIPGYNSINQMIGSSYDADGRLLYDTVNSYSWDAYGKMLGARVGVTTPNCGSGGSYCATYDAAGRIVETSNGGTYKEILYGPTGRLALMTGQSVSEADIPLPGGLTLKATGTGGTGSRTILHNDWLGTNRLATSLGNRTWTWDTAYTPYGETYDTFGTPKQDFTGDFQDIFSGLFDTPNRELATSASRWLSPDPARAGWNQYAYATNPNSMIDPSGLFVCSSRGNGCMTPPSVPEGWGWDLNWNAVNDGFYGGGGDQNIIMGHDIFDAIAKTAGTYFYTNTYGQMSFGFSADLWSFTHNIIDSEAAGTNKVATFNDIPIGTLHTSVRLSADGWTFYVRDYGAFSDTSGIVADIVSLAELAAGDEKLRGAIRNNIPAPLAAYGLNLSDPQFRAFYAGMESLAAELYPLVTGSSWTFTPFPEISAPNVVMPPSPPPNIPPPSPQIPPPPSI